MPRAVPPTKKELERRREIKAKLVKAPAFDEMTEAEVALVRKAVMLVGHDDWELTLTSAKRWLTKLKHRNAGEVAVFVMNDVHFELGAVAATTGVGVRTIVDCILNQVIDLVERQPMGKEFGIGQPGSQRCDPPVDVDIDRRHPLPVSAQVYDRAGKAATVLGIPVSALLEDGYAGIRRRIKTAWLTDRDLGKMAGVNGALGRLAVKYREQKTAE
jgi:hypothetical protein